jgi:hypothetical protein
LDLCYNRPRNQDHARTLSLFSSLGAREKAAREEECMAKRSKSAKKGRSNKWSTANIMNYILGGVVALSMVLGSVFVFGGATPSSQAPQPTAIVATATPVPALSQGVTMTPTPKP